LRVRHCGELQFYEHTRRLRRRASRSRRPRSADTNASIGPPQPDRRALADGDRFRPRGAHRHRRGRQGPGGEPAGAGHVRDRATGSHARKALRPAGGATRTPTIWAIARLLAERGWTKKQLAETAKVGPNTLTNLITHGRASDTDTLARIAAALNLSLPLPGAAQPDAAESLTPNAQRVAAG